jgi:hypothetical protein
MPHAIERLQTYAPIAKHLAITGNIHDVAATAIETDPRWSVVPLRKTFLVHDFLSSSKEPQTIACRSLLWSLQHREYTFMTIRSWDPDLCGEIAY